MVKQTNSWKEILNKYQNSLYGQTREDEFEFYGTVNKTGEFLMEAAEKLDNSTTYGANIKVELDDYDFSSNSFKFIMGRWNIWTI